MIPLTFFMTPLEWFFLGFFMFIILLLLFAGWMAHENMRWGDSSPVEHHLPHLHTPPTHVEEAQGYDLAQSTQFGMALDREHHQELQKFLADEEGKDD